MTTTVSDLELCPGRMIGPDHPVFIIAEIGQNHQGDITIAKKMISAAAQAGVDCVKFQKSSLPDKFNAAALARPYTSPHAWAETYGDHKKYLEFSEDQYRELQNYASEQGVAFTASAMDPVSAKFLDSLNVPFIKIGSGDANNLPLQVLVAQTGRPMVVSTGMCDMTWVRTMVDTIRRHTDKIVLLQCTSSYPTLPQDTCLRVIDKYVIEFPDVHVGYSGHEEGIAISVAAANRGARVIERHFTLNKSWKGSDHKCSLDPNELAKLCHHIHNKTDIMMFKDVFGEEEAMKVVKASMGDEKIVLDSEQSCIEKLGKTIVARRNIPQNTVISSDDIDIKVAEPRGIDPIHVDQYVGKLTNCDIEKDKSITAKMLECRKVEIIQKV